jgi:hypothetical protein
MREWEGAEIDFILGLPSRVYNNTIMGGAQAGIMDAANGNRNAITYSGNTLYQVSEREGKGEDTRERDKRVSEKRAINMKNPFPFY